MTTSTDQDAEFARMLDQQGWTPELFAVFWSAPDRDRIRPMITDDIVGHWPGGHTATGAREYIEALVEVLTMLPDIRLEVLDHAMNGDIGFVRWTMRATGTAGAFTLDGIDCVRTREGRVCENVISFDSAELYRRAGFDSSSSD